MKWLKYKDAQDFLDETGYSIDDGLDAVESELERLKKTRNLL